MKVTGRSTNMESEPCDITKARLKLDSSMPPNSKPNINGPGAYPPRLKKNPARPEIAMIITSEKELFKAYEPTIHNTVTAVQTV